MKNCSHRGSLIRYYLFFGWCACVIGVEQVEGHGQNHKPAVGWSTVAENILLEVLECEFCCACMAEANPAVQLGFTYLVVCDEVSGGCLG